MFHKFENCTRPSQCAWLGHQIKGLQFRLGKASADIRFGSTENLTKEDLILVDKWAMDEHLSGHEWNRLAELEAIERQRLQEVYSKEIFQ